MIEADIRDRERVLRLMSEDVRSGLTSSPKTLPPKWFYDARGSELFEEITVLENILVPVTIQRRKGPEFEARARGQQLKDQAQLDGWLRDGSAAYVESLCEWT